MKWPHLPGLAVTPTHQPQSNPWLDDLQLVRSVLAGGDTPALERFIDRMSCVPTILLHCNGRRRGRLSDEDLADLAQEVLIAVWESLPTYLGQGALESWVYPFCTRQYLQRVRDKHGEPLHSVLHESVHPLDPSPALSDLLATSELVHRHLERLEAVQASVIRARHFDGLDFEEIARRLDQPLTTVKSRYQRGLNVLRSYLAPHFLQDPA